MLDALSLHAPPSTPVIVAIAATWESWCRSLVNGSPILENTGENRRAAGGVQESGTDLMRISSTRVGLTRFLGCLAFLVLASGAIATAAEESRDLAGTWRFRIDRDDLGLAENWANAPLAGEDTVQERAGNKFPI
ncbi:MAG: hypothetical protein ACLQU5_22020 [Isosphaeraceae bacterium]